MKLPEDGRPHPKNDPVSLTRQSEEARTNINKIAQHHMRQRMAGNPNGRQPIYGVVPSKSYHEMMNAIVSLDTQFARLPPKIRKRFHGRPELLLSFLEDDNNRREAVMMGLVSDPELLARMEAEARLRAARGRNGEQLDFTREDGETPESEEALRADEEANPRTGPQGGAAGIGSPKTPPKGRK